ncbi:cyclopropane-fatty-acyl-phospholipid synthase [Ceratobasidium sp. AG-Ba]|nr:cyclopropane-fatty-acyl-phospholipid synthase [Ceratobasidium sp. AG-Ba]QRW07113.1 cyclopropane-fatty-acyl-phospholipid synthase [Ceratobasidium sp. AG-Ba]
MASVGWTPLARLAEKGVLGLMQKITVGHLQVLTPSHVYDFPPLQDGMSPNGPFAKLRVVKDSFWIRLALMSDLGFAEAFMYGDVDCDDLVALFKVFLLNRDALAGMQSSPISMLFNVSQRLTSIRFLNTLSNSRSNISAHYDISNQMFQAFLSPDMTYSCAIFPTLDGDVILEGKHYKLRENYHNNPSSDNEHANSDTIPPDSRKSSPVSAARDELYEAQMIKMRYLIGKLKIPEHSDKIVRVLEIGSGWGALAILLTQTYPFIEVDSITLSSEQKSLAEERLRAAGVEARVRIWLMDYRSIPESWNGIFDRVISIEMVEAVGLEFLPTYWGVLERCMKPREAVGVVQSSTMPEPRYANYIQGIDFIRKWLRTLVFPGAHVPTATSLLDGLVRGGNSKIVVDNVENIGPHYARTLREWRRRFLAKFESDIIPALQREYPDVFDDTAQGRDEIEIFKRKWVYYYCYCEAGFANRTLGGKDTKGMGAACIRRRGKELVTSE